MGKQRRSGIRGAIQNKVWCDFHAKNLYFYRNDAKAVARNHHEPGIREYACEHMDGWHVGHLPYDVRDGITTAKEHYRKRETDGTQQDFR